MPPSRERLVKLIEAMGITPRDLLREKGTPYGELGLADPKWVDDELIDFMLAHPILINRPIVVTPLGTKLCRPIRSRVRYSAQSGHWSICQRGRRCCCRREWPPGSVAWVGIPGDEIETIADSVVVREYQERRHSG